MNKSTPIVSSFAKGMRVLTCFDADHASQSIAEVANRTNMDRATVRRLLLTLHHEGYAHYDGKYFSLTPKCLRLGMDAMSSLHVPRIVQPWLDQLTEKIQQSCSVCVLDDLEIVYLARAAQRRVMSIGLMPGSRLPAHCTSMGRVLLADHSPDEIENILSRSDLTPRTPNSLNNIEDIKKAIQSTKAKGYAVNDQELEIGLCSVAVPLFNQRKQVVAALNVGMAATNDRHELIRDKYLPALLELQARLMTLL